MDEVLAGKRRGRVDQASGLLAYERLCAQLRVLVPDARLMVARELRELPPALVSEAQGEGLLDPNDELLLVVPLGDASDLSVLDEFMPDLVRRCRSPTWSRWTRA
jgi:hypothetical protein